jgi:hypothetical protein
MSIPISGEYIPVDPMDIAEPTEHWRSSPTAPNQIFKVEGSNPRHGEARTLDTTQAIFYNNVLYNRVKL